MSIGTLSFCCGDVADSVWFCLKRRRNFHNPTREISTSSLCKIRNICDGLQPSSFNFMIRSLLWWFSLPIFTCTASSLTYTKCSSRFSQDGKAIPRDWFPSRGTRIPSHGKKFPSHTGLLTFPRSVLYMDLRLSVPYNLLLWEEYIPLKSARWGTFDRSANLRWYSMTSLQSHRNCLYVQPQVIIHLRTYHWFC